MASDNIITPTIKSTKDISLKDTVDLFRVVRESWITELGEKTACFYALLFTLSSKLGYAFASDDYFAKKSSKNLRTLQRSLRLLEKKGWIYRNSWNLGSNLGSKRHIIVRENATIYWNSYLNKDHIPEKIKEDFVDNFLFPKRISADKSVGSYQPTKVSRDKEKRIERKKPPPDSFASHADQALLPSVVSETHQCNGFPSGQNPKEDELLTGRSETSQPLAPKEEAPHKGNSSEPSDSESSGGGFSSLSLSKPCTLTSVSPQLISKSSPKEVLWLEASEAMENYISELEKGSAPECSTSKQVAAAPKEADQMRETPFERQIKTRLSELGLEAHTPVALAYYRGNKKMIEGKGSPLGYLIAAVQRGWAKLYVDRNKPPDDSETGGDIDANRELAKRFAAKHSSKIERWSVRAHETYLSFFFKAGTTPGGFPLGYKDRDFTRKFLLAKKEAEFLDSVSEQELAEIKRLAPTVTQTKPRRK